jgi:hypothetical protein
LPLMVVPMEESVNTAARDLMKCMAPAHL